MEKNYNLKIDDYVTGEAKEVIRYLKDQLNIILSIEGYITEGEIFGATEILHAIQTIHNNIGDEDIISITENPMAGFYIYDEKGDLI
jgi:hypothetical protein